MDILEIFGINVFNDNVMKSTLPENIYNSLKKSINENLPLEPNVAKVVAEKMKLWAISKGATHYTHWFQPMNGITAEKHDSFLSFSKEGQPILVFNEKELIKGEPDASSFPNGGIRATFEARGYTAWDPSSYAFIKDNTLCIPTAFCSYSGEALDEKTPLLRSCDALNKQALKVLRLLGNTTSKSISVDVGAEQEYFLIDKNLAKKRSDILLTGKTLFGAKPPKGQELEDHYYGAINPKVKAFMDELDIELWKLGIYAKTEHNEAAPSQHELAPIFSNVNIATDNNQLTMELMKKIAEKHDLLCLLDEKPFQGVNGSGKHNNWSLSTDDGINLFDPGDTPAENIQFLLFLCAVITASDNYQDLLRLSVASSGNDDRLGGNEAPPAIISIYLGDDLYAILNGICENNSLNLTKTPMKLGAKILPTLPKDTTDRNRTSPLAFTGNKFEFRMVGSSDSIANCNIVLNTIMADTLANFAEILASSKDIPAQVHNIVIETMKNHKRILFNGNNYSEEWKQDAEKRGLLNLSSTPLAIDTFSLEKNIKLFEKNKVFSSTEIMARQQIMYEKYSRIINIEALTSIDMVKKQIYPSINEYVNELIEIINSKEKIGIKALNDINIVKKLSSLNDRIFSKCKEIEKLLNDCKSITKPRDIAFFYHDEILSAMKIMRSYCDEAESLSSSKYWPFPTYKDLLY